MSVEFSSVVFGILIARCCLQRMCPNVRTEYYPLCGVSCCSCVVLGITLTVTDSVGSSDVFWVFRMMNMTQSISCQWTDMPRNASIKVSNYSFILFLDSVNLIVWSLTYEGRYAFDFFPIITAFVHKNLAPLSLKLMMSW